MGIFKKFTCKEEQYNKRAIRPPLLLEHDVKRIEEINYTFTNQYSLTVRLGVHFNCTEAALPHATKNAERQILSTLFDEHLALVREAAAIAYEYNFMEMLPILSRLEATMLEP